MKNVTLALDENLLAAGRQYAQEHHTSLNSLIRRLLEQTVRQDRSRNQLEEFFRIADAAGGDSHGQRWKREDLYDV